MKASFLKIASIQALAAVLLFEVVGGVFYKNALRSLYYYYHHFHVLGKEIPRGNGYPKYYFSRNATRGFDIAKNASPTLAALPYEANASPIWGNEIGCYDKSVSSEHYKVYIGGDSFAWGFAKFNQKFGTLLEDKLQVGILKCGVTHTGQIHQYEKFKEITQSLGYIPKLVIVTVYLNDIADDFSHPHSTVHDGYLIDTSSWIKQGDDNYSFTNASQEEIEKEYNARFPTSSSNIHQIVRKFDPRVMSATAVLGIEALKKLKNIRIKSKRALPASKDQAIHSANHPKKGTGLGIYIKNNSYPIHAQFASRNRKIIKQWIQDSKDNDYHLVFAITNHFEPSYYDDFKSYIKSQGGTIWDFNTYLYDKGIKQHDLHWSRDGHWNSRGNQIFADFLYSKSRNKF